MRKISFRNALLALSMAFVAVSCTNESDYAVLIPDDALFVMKFDTKQLLEKSGVGENEGIKDKFISAIEDAGMPSAVEEKMLACVEDPVQLGLDLRYPLYVYMTAEKDGGCVGAVLDKSNLEDLFNTLAKEEVCERVKTSGSLSYTMIDNDAVVAFDDDRFAILPLPYEYRDDESGFVDKIELQFENTVENSILQNENFTKVLDSDADAVYFMSGEAVGDIREFREAEKIYEQMGISMDEIDYMFALAFNSGETVLSCDVLPKTTSAEEFFEKSLACVKNVSGNHFKYVDNSSLAAMSMGINGVEMMEYLQEVGLFDMMERIYGDMSEYSDVVSGVLESLDGDVTVAVEELSGFPTLVAVADTKDDKLFKLLESTLGQISEARKVSSTHYTIDEDSEQCGAFGMNGDELYFVMGKTELAEVSAPMNSDDYEDAPFCMCLYVDKLMDSPLLDELSRSERQMLRVAEPVIDEIEMLQMTGTNGHSELKVIMKDTDANLLTLIGETVLRIAEENM